MQNAVEGDALRAAAIRAGGSRAVCWEWEPMPAQNRSQLDTAIFQSRCSPPSSAAWAVGEQSSIFRTNFGLTGGQERSLWSSYNLKYCMDTSWLYLVSVFFSCASSMYRKCCLPYFKCHVSIHSSFVGVTEPSPKLGSAVPSLCHLHEQAAVTASLYKMLF